METQNYFGLVYQNFTTDIKEKISDSDGDLNFTDIKEAIEYGKVYAKHGYRFNTPSEEHFRLYIAKFENDVEKDEQIEIFRTHTCYRIKHGNGYTYGKNQKHSFDKFEEAVSEAKEFKQNPRSHNPNMSDSNVEYWKNETYIIKKEVTISTELEII